MADFRTHITTSTVCGVIYGGAAVNPLGFTPETAALAAGVTAVGGMLPDLDSDSGRPVRELSNLAAAALPLLLTPRMLQIGLSHEGMLVGLGVMYLLIRYGVSRIMKRISVHRGMFHSLPAMLIAGLIVYLEYNSDSLSIRLLLAGGVMVGFLSHLILDEIYSVDFNGIRIKLKSSAGSALKFFSNDWLPNFICYTLMGLLGYLAYLDWNSQVHP